VTNESYRGKRIVDLAVTAVLAAPALLLGAACALVIMLDDGGPVFFRQERVGMGGRTFPVLKFRTMVHGGANPLFPDASRITRSGVVLRRLSLDELPQLLNVAKGDMSIVGPRPTLAYQVERYTPDQRRRLAVRPGLTGLAQVRGRNTIAWADRIELDLEYLDKQSVLYDLYLLLLSVRVLFSEEIGGHPVNDPIARLDEPPGL
jgi:lipopolysaccharide/colanic/teichoic acid biosynthesis glycosyltransferase